MRTSRVEVATQKIKCGSVSLHFVEGFGFESFEGFKGWVGLFIVVASSGSCLSVCQDILLNCLNLKL